MKTDGRQPSEMSKWRLLLWVARQAFKLPNKKQMPEVRIQQANATLYPNQILIVTVDRTVAGYSITTTAISKLPVHASPNEIGQAIRKHLSLSKTTVPAPENFKTHYQNFLKAAGFKNAKEHHNGARYLSIYLKNEEIIISPTKNGGATGREGGFIGSKELPPIHVSASATDQELGKQIKVAWSKCVDKSLQ